MPDVDTGLVSIEITPDPATCTDEGQIQLAAIGTYDDASTLDISDRCYWHVQFDAAGILTVATGTAHPGLVTGIGAGVAAVHAIRLPADIGDHVDVTVTESPPLPEPVTGLDGRVFLAFGAATLDPDPAWTRLDDVDNLVTSYTIDRGRQYELDRTDTGRATVQIADPDGILDPTNPGGPYYGQLQPLLQAAVCRRNPVTGDWKTRYRGFVEDFSYEIDPSQQVNRLVLSLVDLFDVVSACEMQPGEFGTTPPVESEGQVYYARQTFHDRVTAVLGDTGIPGRLWVVFPGNVYLKPVIYSPGESALSAIQEAADGEFPGVGNTYCDRKGRLCCHDHKSRFDPAGVSADVGAAKWDFREWKAGDSTAVTGSLSDTAQVRELAFSRSLSKIINHASATPVGIIDSDIPGALYVDATSIGLYGIRSWSADNLLTDGDIAAVTGDLFESKQFAIFYVSNYAQPRDRITTIGFRPLHPDDPRAPALWEFLNTVDISDSVEVTVAAPGGGGFTSEAYFVEGIHEQAGPLTPDYDDVTLRLDLSPRAYYTVDPFP